MELKHDQDGKFQKLLMPSKEELENLYLIKSRTPFEIAKSKKTSSTTVRRWLQEYGIPIKRPYTSYVKLGLSTVESAYLAGYLDGDGTINVGLSTNIKSKTGIANHYDVSLISKNKEYIEKLRQMVGGKVRSFVYHDSREKKEGYRLMFANQASALAFLEQINPYLILKKEQARFMIAFLKDRIEARKAGGNCSPTSDFSWECIKAIRRLNNGKNQKY